MESLAPGDPANIGPYALVGRLGAGGMGRVYLGRDAEGREAAIKVVRPELAEERDFRRRFAREVNAARAVDGRYTAAVLDADPDAETPWLATAYIPGSSLADHIIDHGAMDEAQLRRLAAGLAYALSAIHAAGLIHRDLKPSNILLADDGPRVIDFGIARAAEASALTRTGVTIGSPGYMSPEQINGRPVETPSDVFSLGAVLAYAATGRSPFGAGATPALLYRVVHNPPDLTGVPDALLPLITACLDKHPQARPTVPQILATVVPPVMVAPTPVEQTPTLVEQTDTRVATRTLPVPSGLSRRRVLAAGGAAAVAVTAALSAPALLTGSRKKPRTNGPSPAPVDTHPVNPPRTLWQLTVNIGITPGETTAVATGNTVLMAENADKDGGEVDGTLSGLDPKNGARRWKWTAPGVPTMIRAVAQSHNALYVATESRFYALQESSRKQLWSAKAPFWVFDVVDTAVAGWADDGSGPSTLICLDRAGGHRRWTYSAGAVDTDWISVSDTIVAFADGSEMTAPNVYAMDTVTGKQRWQFAAGRYFGPPLATNDTVYAGGQKSSPFCALDAKTGQVRWKAAFGQADTAPVADRSTVYVIDDSANTLHALNVTDGSERWKFEGTGFGGVWGPFSGVVYLTGFHDMTYALHAETGRLLWSYHAIKPQRVATTSDNTLILTCSPAVEKNTLYGLHA
ncbi:serine/threonine-protein kinase [Actinoallomurus sp. CA-150999]|uniref:serine/threonine-protein kinase n=1 Tax=Actinoallomurus sp. CA-150999 TaxID=3239887 RepID=UPI003D9251F7